MSNLGKIERHKLIANLLNALAAVIVTVGIFVPLASIAYDVLTATTEPSIWWILPIVCICAAVVPHLAGPLFLTNSDNLDET
jgi:hypothetical protein